MNQEKKTIYSLEELKEFIGLRRPGLYVSSQTSTVIPYDKYEGTVVDINQIPGDQELRDGNLICRGNTTWKDARSYARSYDLQVKTYPTEELAAVCAGVATSCTGERSFGFGTLRNQVVSLEYMDFEGKLQTLSRDKKLSDHEIFQNKEAKTLLKNYQKAYSDYHVFKNAPFPRMENETDLMIGTEGQLGIVASVELELTKNSNLSYLFVSLPKWEEDDSLHFEVFDKVQEVRGLINCVELIDSNSLDFLKEEDRPCTGRDLIFFEFNEENLEKIYEGFILKLNGIDEEQVFEMSESKFQTLRMGIPRAVFERNSAMGVVKKGTDVQVRAVDFPKLMDIYRSFSKIGVGYNLFGHFGDAHLHFNFMPLPDQVEVCQKKLMNLYKEVEKLKGSPFAEHGIGLVKKDFIKRFLSENHFELFKYLKDRMDPHQQFFPQGFMTKW